MTHLPCIGIVYRPFTNLHIDTWEWMTVYDIQGILTVSYSNDKALRGVSNPLVYHMWHLSLTWDFPYITLIYINHTKNHQSHVITNLLGTQFQGACLFDPFLEPVQNSPMNMSSALQLFIASQVWVTMALFLFLFIFAVIVCTMVGQDIDIRRVSWQHSGAHWNCNP